LTADQERDLRIHLRNCPQCAVLARANMALRAAPMSTPAEGFAMRFQTRLVEERKAQNWRSFLGWILLLLIGLGVALLVATPYLAYLTSPTKLVGTWVNGLSSINTSLRVVSLVGATFLDVLESFVPPYVWFLSMVLFGGAVFLWVSSLRKFGNNPHTATHQLKE